MTEFMKNELKGRELFETFLKASNATNWEFSQDPYSVFDCKYWCSGKTYIVEIKVRNLEYTKYDTWILEEQKYKSLISLCDENTIAVYINFFNDDYFSIWNISKLQVTETINLTCKRTTVENNGYTQKSIIELPISSAEYFGKIINDQIQIIWRKTN